MIAALLVALQLLTHQGIQRYDAWLDTPGGELRFGIELHHDGAWTAFLINGEERIEVPQVTSDGRELALAMPHYDSRIRATVEDSALLGTWEKRRGPHDVAQLPFHARRLPPTVSADSPPTPVPLGQYKPLTGRWAFHFEGEQQTSVGLLEQHGAELRGTVLTSSGDYRYLTGSVETTEVAASLPACAVEMRASFRLSSFDGAQAFLLEGEGSGEVVRGDFYSGNWSHETWTAKRDDNAHLDDPFAQTHWNGKTKLADLRFPDLDGKLRSLGDAQFAGSGYLLVVFGSWCPNCNDEARFLAELDAKYRAQGLRILGLAFELTGERERDAGQVKIFAARHGLTFPMFLCGTNDKDEATKALNLVDQVRAFPTTIFVGADGLVRAIHSGYSGPATGEEHTKLRAEFERRIGELLGATPR